MSLKGASSPAQAGTGKGEAAVESLTWRVWPLQDDWKRGLLAFTSLILFPVIFYYSGGRSLGLALFTFLILFFSITGFLLPAHY
ncbi:MAG: hypothetical protein ACRD2L_14845, partial [Terriglobia bacterium]